MPPEPATLVALLHEAARRHGERPALSARHDLRNEVWSYQKLARRVTALALHLSRGLSLQPRDRVMVCAANGPHTVVAHLAAMQAGLTVVPMDLGASPDFIARIAALTEARLLLGGAETPRVAGVAFADLKTIAADSGREWTGRMPERDDVAQVVFTSGTTGEPKGTMLSHGNIVANVMSASGIVPPQVPLHLLSILPLSHMLEQTVGLYLPLFHGGSVHYGPSLQPAILMRDMRRCRPNGMVVVPRILELLLQAIEGRIRAQGQGEHWDRRLRLAARLPIGLRNHLFARLHRQLGGELRFFLCGGASLPAELGQTWETLGVRVIEGYGSTECSPVITSTTYRRRRLGTVGWPVKGVEVKLSGDGEVWVRGANVSRGYWCDAERSALSFTPDGWFRTGDIAERDAEGAYCITARLNDRIVLASGQKVHSADVEDEIRRQDGIEDCAVIGLADDGGHERVHAVLWIAANRDAEATATAAIRTANARLGSHQRILGHTIWTAGPLPRTSLGKLKRNEVKRALEARASPRPATPRPATPEDALKQLLRQAGKKQPQINEESDLAEDLGIDSLGRVELVSAIESRLGIIIDEGSLAKVHTVRELRALVSSGTRVPEEETQPDWPRRGFARALRSVLQAAVLFPLQGEWCRPLRIEGAERLEKLTGPVLLIANHSSHVDTISLLKALPRELRGRTAVAAAADYFYRTRTGGVLASLVLNTFAFSRSGNIRASLERCGELADEGWSILICPEGTRSPDGGLLPFKGGIGLLARGLHVPVVPMAVIGGAAVLPKGALWPRRGAVSVRIGAPIRDDFGTDTGEVASRLQAAVAELMSGKQEHGS